MFLEVPLEFIKFKDKQLFYITLQGQHDHATEAGQGYKTKTNKKENYRPISLLNTDSKISQQNMRDLSSAAYQNYIILEPRWLHFRNAKVFPHKPSHGY